MPNERRTDRFHIDRTLNLSGFIGFLMLMATIFHYGSGILATVTDANSKINIMWDQFVVTNPQYKGLFHEAK